MMMISTRSAVTLAAIGLLLFSLSACGKKETAAEDKGPAQKAGQQLDKAAAQTAEELKSLTQKAGKSVEELGQRMQKEAEEARKSGE